MSGSHLYFLLVYLTAGLSVLQAVKWHHSFVLHSVQLSFVSVSMYLHVSQCIVLESPVLLKSIKELFYFHFLGLFHVCVCWASTIIQHKQPGHEILIPGG